MMQGSGFLVTPLDALPFLTWNSYSCPCGADTWVKRRQSWLAEGLCITNWHHGAVQALDRRGTGSLAFQRPKHGSLVPQTCSVWDGGQIYHSLSCGSEGSRCRFFKKAALLQSTRHMYCSWGNKCSVNESHMPDHLVPLREGAWMNL